MSTKTSSELLIQQNEIKKAALVLRSINHPLRQKMIHLLHKNSRMNVTSLYTYLKLEQSVASQHLAILRRASFVTTEREGKEIYYSVNYKRLQEVQRLGDALLQAA